VSELLKFSRNSAECGFAKSNMAVLIDESAKTINLRENTLLYKSLKHVTVKRRYATSLIRFYCYPSANFRTTPLVIK